MWIIPLLIQIVTSSKHCTLHHEQNLAVRNNRVKFRIPLPLTLIETELDRIDTTINFTGKTFGYEKIFTKEGTTKKILVPNEQAGSIMLGKANCIKSNMAAATLIDIRDSGIQHLYRNLSSVNYVLNKEGNIECFLETLHESGKECFDGIHSLNISNNMNNMTEFVSHIKNMTLGILGFKDSHLEIQNDTGCLLPCIVEAEMDVSSKWAILKQHYLLPMYSRIMARYISLKNWIKQDKGNRNNDMRTKIVRKRSLLSSILGLAGSDETEELRKALKIELKSQRSTNKVVEDMLREQILTAKAINKDHKLLFSLKAHEEKLEGTIGHLTSYLHEAMNESYVFEKKIHNDIQSIMLTMTSIFSLLTLDNHLDYIASITHCPHGKCFEYIHNYLVENYIGDMSTYPIIIDNMRMTFEENSVLVTVENITKSDIPIFQVHCLPLLNDNQTMLIDIKGSYAAAFNGFMKLDTCVWTHSMWYCTKLTWKTDKCLSAIMIRKSITVTDCMGHLVNSDITQDYIVDNKELVFFSSEYDTIVLTCEGRHQKGFLNRGINIFPLTETSDMSVHTKWLTFTIESDIVNNLNEDMYLPIDTVDLYHFHTNTQNIHSPTFNWDMTPESEEEGELTTIPVPEYHSFPPILIELTDAKNWYWTLGGLSGVIMVIMLCIFGICRLKRKICCQLATHDMDMTHQSTDYHPVTASEPTTDIQMPETEPTMYIFDMGFYKEVRTTAGEDTLYWDGLNWRNLATNTINVLKHAPPTHLKMQLKPTNTEQVVTQQGSKHVISLVGIENVYFDTLRSKWMINDTMCRRILPFYVTEKPNREMLRELTQSKQAK